jgi:hypothetical protein
LIVTESTDTLQNPSTTSCVHTASDTLLTRLANIDLVMVSLTDSDATVANARGSTAAGVVVGGGSVAAVVLVVIFTGIVLAVLLVVLSEIFHTTVDTEAGSVLIIGVDVEEGLIDEVILGGTDV